MTNDGLHSYQYDAENRLVKVDNGATASYGYDHQNRRIVKTIGTARTHYIWEGAQVISEHNGKAAQGAWSTLVDYVRMGSRLVATRNYTVTQYCDKNNVCTPVVQTAVKYYLSDRLSTRLVLDSNGTVVGRQAHLPFGEEIAASGQQEKHHFTSYERDAETGFDYAVNRHHTVGLGRFSSVDRGTGNASNPQSLNRYSYTQNDPINLVDPTGNTSIIPGVGSGGIAVDTVLAWMKKHGPKEAIQVRGNTPGDPNPYADASKGPPLVQPVSPLPGVQDPPAPIGPIPGEDISDPPIPPIRSLADLNKYWDAIKKAILKNGECSKRLKRYERELERMRRSGKLSVLDARDPAVSGRTYAPGNNETVQQYFDRTGDAAFTFNRFVNTTPRTRISTTIYLGEGYYNTITEVQPALLFHEMLHGSLMQGEDQLGEEFNMPHDNITDWIKGGCK